MSCPDNTQSCIRWGHDPECCTTSYTCLPGLGCCPNQYYCNGECCSTGEVCVDRVCQNLCGDACSSTETCCPVTDGSYVCCTENTTCVALQGICCPKEQYCEGSCCASGQVCTTSGCVIPTQTCTCDLTTENCCYNGNSPYLCCSQTQEVCIPAGGSTEEGSCCPIGQYCNGACCPNGWSCQGGQCVCTCPCANPADCCLDNCQVNPPYLCCNSEIGEKCAQNMETGKVECCPADRYLNGKCCRAGWHVQNGECTCNCQCANQQNCCLDSCYVDPPYICCENGDECIRGEGSGRALCCPASRTCNNQTTCCPVNTICCLEKCCNEGEICCNGTCCKNGHCLNGACCEHVCLDGTCCDGGGQCCWGKSCMKGGFRSGNQCCFTNPWNIDTCVPEAQI